MNVDSHGDMISAEIILGSMDRLPERRGRVSMSKAFDRLAPHYDRWIGRFMSNRMDRMAELLSCSPGEIVLDLGGGTGLLARRLVGRCTEVHLLDESRPMLEQVHDRKILKQIGCATKTPYEDDSFDAIILSDVFHHVRLQEALLDEILRLLKPGGRLLVNEVDLDRFLGRLLARMENSFFVRVYPTGYECFCECMSQRGFRLTRSYRDAWSFIGLWRLEAGSPGGGSMPHPEFP
jgi:demethylmenaquinone methyltransferase/2-methoxy-6-polyprenyl-1,4-benzoquinol methylase